MSKFKVTRPINAHTVNAQYLPKWKDCQAVKQPIGCSVEAVATMIGCLPTQAIAFGWKPGFSISWTCCCWWCYVSCRASDSRPRQFTIPSVLATYVIVVTVYNTSTIWQSSMTPALTFSTSSYLPAMTSPTGSPYFRWRHRPTTNYRSTRCHVTSTSFRLLGLSARSTTVRRRGESLLVTSHRVQRATPVNFVLRMRGNRAELTLACL